MKQQQELKRLYWKNDKEQIMQIMHHLNIKYLLSLYKKAIHAQRDPTKNDWETAYTKVYKIVNYDGCRFQASVKTIKDELKRRDGIGEVIPVNYTLPNSRTFKIKWQINKNS